jgi:hypothetical protein
MKNRTETIRKAVGLLNNAHADGGFWLPNIQRPFVWHDDQICRLFDSIMREYPIGTLLVWKTTQGVRRRKFIDNWHPSLRLTDFRVPDNDRPKYLVLDGQQRLQSLYIGLSGTSEGRELYLDVLSGDVTAPEDIKYRFEFRDEGTTEFPWIRFKDLIFTSKKKRELIDWIADAAGRELTTSESNKLEDHLDLIDRTFKMEEAISYQELDSIDAPSLYREDDVVEIFIRANSGGTKLGKSDLLFSLLSSTWEHADENMESLLQELNRFGFAFDRDFVLKTSLCLLHHGARYEVNKFRKPGVREEIESKWEAITAAVSAVLDFVRSKTYIQCDKALPSYLVLIPMVYLAYHHPKAFRAGRNMDEYLLRCSLTGAFSGNPDNLLDATIGRIKELTTFDLNELYGVIRSQGRSLELTEERFWELGYGSDSVHLLFNLWYRDFNHTPAYENNLPQIDHIFPQSQLRKIKTRNPSSGRMDVLKYHESQRNQLANCMLLTREENGSGGKADTLPEIWFADKNEEYLQKHLIPEDESLWKLDRFEDFIAARKELIRDKFRTLLVPVSTIAAV